MIKVTVYSADDEVDVKIPDDPTEAAGIIPIRKTPDYKTCKMMWEGTLQFLPDNGDVIFFPTDTPGPSPFTEENNGLYVLTRAFYVNADGSFSVALFVTSNSNVDYDDGYF